MSTLAPNLPTEIWSSASSGLTTLSRSTGDSLSLGRRLQPGESTVCRPGSSQTDYATQEDTTPDSICVSQLRRNGTKKIQPREWSRVNHVALTSHRSRSVSFNLLVAAALACLTVLAGATRDSAWDRQNDCVPLVLLFF